MRVSASTATYSSSRPSPSTSCGHTAISQLKPGDIDWDHLFGTLGVRWLHTGGIYAALSESAAAVAEEAMTAAHRHGTMISYDLNYRPSLWKRLGGKAKVADLAEHRFIVAMTAANGSNRNVRQTLWRTLQNHTVEASTTVNMQKRLSPAVFDKTADSVWQFAGDWSEACTDLIALVDHIRGGPQGAATVQRYSTATPPKD